MDDAFDPTVTELLREVAEGGSDARERLLTVVYEELHRMARGRVAREGAGIGIQASDLVNEAYLRVFGDRVPEFECRRHFFGAAAQAMQRVLIDAARARRSEKRGGARERVPLEQVVIPERVQSIDILALDDALNRFQELDPRAAEIVRLRYFLDLSVDETAEVMSISPRTVHNDWNAAKGWLKQRMHGPDGSSP